MTAGSGGSVDVRRVDAVEHRLREFLRHTDEVGQSAFDGVAAEMPASMYEVMTLFSRTKSQFMAIRLLIENGLLEEALSLSRGLFTDSLRLEYLAAASPEVREGVYLDRQREGRKAFRAKFGDQAAALGLDGLNAEDLASVDRELRDISERARRRGVVIKGYPPDRVLARRFGRLEDLWLHLLSHDAVHGSQLMLQLRTTRRGGTHAISTRSFDSRRMCAIGIHSIKSTLRSQVFAFTMRGWDSGPAATLLGDVITWEAEFEEGHEATRP